MSPPIRLPDSFGDPGAAVPLDAVARTGRAVGIVLVVLAVVGAPMEGRHLYGLMAVDAPLDLARGCIGVSLLVVTLGRTDRERRDRWIVAAGILLLMVAVSGLVDRQLFGLVPSSLTPVDLLVTTALGVLLLRAGVRGSRRSADREDPAEAG